MSMTDVRLVGIDEFLPTLNGLVVGVPRSVAVVQLRNALIEFCEKSKYWRETLRSFSPAAGGVYELDDIPSDTVVAGDIAVRYAFNEEKVSSDLYVMTNPYTIKFDDSVTEQVEVSCAVKPNQRTMTIPVMLCDHFAEGICAGAAVRLLRMPNKPWSDPSSVAYYQDLFRECKNQAMKEALEQYQSFGTHKRVNRQQSYW